MLRSLRHYLAVRPVTIRGKFALARAGLSASWRKGSGSGRFVAPGQFLRVPIVIRSSGYLWDIRPHSDDLEMVLPDHKPALTRWVHPAPGEVVIDVGAHVGFFSVVAARAGARVIAIEPNPELVVQLRQNLSLNAADSVQVFECAAGEREGMETLLVPGTVRGFATLDPHRFDTSSRGPPPQLTSVLVPVRTLDSLGVRSLTGGVDWLLIDTEGGEASVLRGAPETLARTRRVVIEVTQGEGGAEVDRILQGAGFSLRERVAQTPRTEYRFFEKTEPLHQGDAPEPTPSRSVKGPSDAN